MLSDGDADGDHLRQSYSYPCTAAVLAGRPMSDLVRITWTQQLSHPFYRNLKIGGPGQPALQFSIKKGDCRVQVTRMLGLFPTDACLQYQSHHTES